MPKPIAEEKPKPPSFREFPALLEAKFAKLTKEYIQHRTVEKAGKVAEVKKKAIGQQIVEVLKKVGQKSVDVDETTVTVTRGSSPDVINREKLLRELVAEFDIDPDKAVQVVDACTDEGKEYFFATVTVPKEDA